MIVHGRPKRSTAISKRIVLDHAVVGARYLQLRLADHMRINPVPHWNGPVCARPIPKGEGGRTRRELKDSSCLRRARGVVVPTESDAHAYAGQTRCHPAAPRSVPAMPARTPDRQSQSSTQPASTAQGSRLGPPPAHVGFAAVAHAVLAAGYAHVVDTAVAIAGGARATANGARVRAVRPVGAPAIDPAIGSVSIGSIGCLPSAGRAAEQEPGEPETSARPAHSRREGFGVERARSTAPRTGSATALEQRAATIPSPTPGFVVAHDGEGFSAIRICIYYAYVYFCSVAADPGAGAQAVPSKSVDLCGRPMCDA